MTKKKICVIGAGVSGLTAVKCCKEEGLEVVCFEKSDSIGGIWHYHEDDETGRPSVMKSTVINTSKELCAFSDFPPPEHLPNFMHNTVMLKYLQLYAENFKVYDNIKFNREVVKVHKSRDYNTSGKWMVCVKDTLTENEENLEFDGVMVCSGHHIYPNIPTFPGIEKFQGKVIHTHSLKTPDSFKDLNVLVVGIGNSGVDAAVEISTVAKKVYLSSRHGSWIIPRLGPWGMPNDTFLLKRFLSYLLEKWNYFHIADRVLQLALNIKFDHARYNIQPEYSVLAAHATINDALPNHIISGLIQLKPDVHIFSENGVKFKNDNDYNTIDAVVLATGYDIKFPFLDEDVIQVKDNQVDLYKLVFPPNLSHATLAFIGLIQPLGCLFPIAEAQSRWFAAIQADDGIKLPSHTAMTEEIKMRREKMSKQYFQSKRHTIQVHYIQYLDDIYTEIGTVPNQWWLALTDPKVFYTCWFRTSFPYQYRLHGRHPWKGARNAILQAENRIWTPFKKNLKPKISNTRQNFHTMK